MIEENFDVSFIADLARREKQIQQNYRPIIAVHKWFARRPGTLFRGILLSEFGSKPLKELYFQRNTLSGVCIVDPFMGGGTPLLEANRLSCKIIGFDINPMAYWIVKQEINNLDINAYRDTAYRLRQELETKIGSLYQTKCSLCGSKNAKVKYFLWVKVYRCSKCNSEIELFPGYLISENVRHPKNVVLCKSCMGLIEIDDINDPGYCTYCGSELAIQGPARHNRCICHECGYDNKFPDATQGVPRHHMFAIEYYCPICKKNHKGRFFKKPDFEDLLHFDEAKKAYLEMNPEFIPNEEIPLGKETNRLHRWGYQYYKDMFNERQLLGLELSCRMIAKQPNERIRDALATNLSDLLRYQNMLCRYDTMALKSLDIFSIHGFPVGLIQCESNILGISNGIKEMSIGSGGWSNIIDKFAKAKSYCESPFEIKHIGKKKIVIKTIGEWIGDINDHDHLDKREIELYCKSAINADLPSNTVDAVLTDPPYYGNVQYAELMDFCYIWLHKLVNDNNLASTKYSTRNSEELTINAEMGRNIDHFTEGLSAIFQKMAKALKPNAPLVFTYHHNTLEAYLPIAVAILDSGLICSASLPVPAEMEASIHIKGTKSSVIDTLFVNRSTNISSIDSSADIQKEIAKFLIKDINELKLGGINPTEGDVRCIIYGHLIRSAILHLRNKWDKDKPIKERLCIVNNWIKDIDGINLVKHILDSMNGGSNVTFSL